MTTKATSWLEKNTPKLIELKPFTFVDIERYSANPIERVEQDGMFALRCSDADEIEMRFRLRIMATEPERVEVTWPATWWDAVKQRWFPRWALRRWPARMNYVCMERAGLYPEIPWRKSHGRKGKLTAIPYLSEERTTFEDRGEGND
jgi:hypothetical protein